MGVAVLSPQDCLREGVSRHHRRLISPPRSKARRSTGTHNASPAQTRSGRRKQWSPAGSPPPPQSKPNNKEAKANPAKSPGVTGQVRILKRGEELTPAKQSSAETTPLKNRKTKREGSIDRSNSDPVVSATLLLKSPKPAPAPIRNLFVNGFYAGSAFSTSPPPSSLPVPGFCTKNLVGSCSAAASTAEDVVALDLRRMLRIEY